MITATKRLRSVQNKADLPSVPRPPQLIYGKNDPMFTLPWQVHSAADRAATAGKGNNYTRGICQRCGRTDLRLVHTLESPDFPDRIEVGRECAHILCPSYDAERVERKLERRKKRLAKWMARPWYESVIGNHYLNGSSFQYGIVAFHPGFRWWILGSVGIWSEVTYNTFDEARISVFNYCECRDMLGIQVNMPQSFSLIDALKDIDAVANDWSEQFDRRTSSFLFANLFTPLGRAECSIYSLDSFKPYWEFFLTLPDLKLGAKKYYGPTKTCQTAGEAKIAALEMFRKEMVRLVYIRAGLTPQPDPPQLTEFDRRSILQSHGRAEEEYHRQSEKRRQETIEEQRRKEADQKKEEWNRTWGKNLETKTHIVVKDTSLDEFRWDMKRLGDASARLTATVDTFCNCWKNAFTRAKTGSYTAKFTFESVEMKCTVFPQAGKWKVGVFLPFDIVTPWHRSEFNSAQEAVEAARTIFSIKVKQWGSEVLPKETDR